MSSTSSQQLREPHQTCSRVTIQSTIWVSWYISILTGLHFCPLKYVKAKKKKNTLIACLQCMHISLCFFPLKTGTDKLVLICQKSSKLITSCLDRQNSAFAKLESNHPFLLDYKALSISLPPLSHTYSCFFPSKQCCCFDFQMPAYTLSVWKDVNLRTSPRQQE